MNKITEKIAGWNFKRIAVGYLMTLLIAGICCIAAAGVVFRKQIAFAWEYAKFCSVSEKGDMPSLETRANLLSSSSDVVNVLILDKENTVLYSADDLIMAGNKFTLIPLMDQKGYFTDSDANVVYRSVDKKEFLLSSLLNEDPKRFRDEYEEDSFYKENFSDQKVILLNYINGKDGNKIYLLTEPSGVYGGKQLLKGIACLAIFLFMIYWVLLALYVFQKAGKAGLDPFLWGILVLLTNLAGFLAYLFCMRESKICPECGRAQSKENAFCIQCGVRLSKSCPKCGASVGTGDRFCRHCGTNLLSDQRKDGN